MIKERADGPSWMSLTVVMVESGGPLHVCNKRGLSPLPALLGDPGAFPLVLRLPVGPQDILCTGELTGLLHPYSQMRQFRCWETSYPQQPEFRVTVHSPSSGRDKKLQTLSCPSSQAPALNSSSQSSLPPGSPLPAALQPLPPPQLPCSKGTGGALTLILNPEATLSR